MTLREFLCAGVVLVPLMKAPGHEVGTRRQNPAEGPS